MSTRLKRRENLGRRLVAGGIATAAITGLGIKAPAVLNQAADFYCEKNGITSAHYGPVRDVTQTEATPERPRIMTLNIHSYFGVGHTLNSDAIDGIVELVHRDKPDLLTLQEVDVGTARAGGMNQVEVLRKRLAALDEESQPSGSAFGAAHCFITPQPGHRAGFGNAVVVRNGYTVLGAENYRLPGAWTKVTDWIGPREMGSSLDDLPRPSMPRSVLVTTVVSPLGRKFFLLSAHFSYEGDAARTVQTDALIELVKQLSAQGEVLVGGDFNEYPNRPNALRLLQEGGLTDTFCFQRGDSRASRYFYSVDRILTTASVIKGARMRDSGDTSDHDGISAVVELDSLPDDFVG
jgi:endonuclease/exonuclease/phosphatase family metal-dependent hydrolase